MHFTDYHILYWAYMPGVHTARPRYQPSNLMSSIHLLLHKTMFPLKFYVHQSFNTVYLTIKKKTYDNQQLNLVQTNYEQRKDFILTLTATRTGTSSMRNYISVNVFTVLLAQNDGDIPHKTQNKCTTLFSTVHARPPSLFTQSRPR